MARKCKCRKKDGERCGADAQTGKSLCVFHDPARASEGRRARRAGGIGRSRVAAVLSSDTPDHPLGDTSQVSINRKIKNRFLPGSICGSRIWNLAKGKLAAAGVDGRSVEIPILERARQLASPNNARSGGSHLNPKLRKYFGVGRPVFVLLLLFRPAPSELTSCDHPVQHEIGSPLFRAEPVVATNLVLFPDFCFL